MSSVTKVAFGRNTQVFAAKETTPGTRAIPVATDLIVANAIALQVPNPNFVDDAGIRNSRSKFYRYPAHTPAAPWNITHYLRPPGAAGSVPEGAAVLESAFGSETIVPSTSVAYDPADTQPSFTLYVKRDHTVFSAAGCAVNRFSTKKDNKGILEVTEEGMAMHVCWTGTDALGEAITTTPAAGTEEEWLVDNPKRFKTGGHIIIDSEQMEITGTDWEGTAAAGKIKMKRGYNSTTPATHLISAAITPWLPTGTETGAPLSARIGTVTIDAVSTKILDITMDLDNGTVFNEDEVTGQETPDDYFEGDRTVSGKMTVLFRRADLAHFADAEIQDRKAIVINYGSVAGKLIAITLGYCELDVPPLSGDREQQKAEVTFHAYASAGNDEAQLKFI